MIPWLWSWGSLAAIYAIICLHTFVHGSILLSIATFLPVVALTLWFSWWFNGRRSWTRWAIVSASLRVFFLSAFLGVALDLIAYESGVHDAWSRQIPLIFATVPIIPIKALPGFTALMFGAYLVAYYFIVFRLKRLPLLVTITFLAAWLYCGVVLFYFNTFPGSTADEVASQSGVSVLFPNQDVSCSIFSAGERRCSVRVFPRGMARDPVTGRFVLAFGSSLRVSPRGESNLLAFDPQNNEIYSFKEMKGTNQVRDIWFEGHERLFAASAMGRSEIDVYSLDDWSLRRTIKVEKGPTDWDPFYVALQGKYVYVVKYWFPEILKYEIESGMLVARYDGWKSGVAIFGGCFHMAAIAPRHKRLYVLNLAFSKQLLEFDLADLSLLRSLDLPAFGGYGLSVNEEAGRIFIQNYFPSVVLDVDIDTLKITKKHQGIYNLRYLTYDEKRRCIYEADWVEGMIKVLDIDSDRYIRSYLVGGKPSAVMLVGDHLYVHSVVGVVRIDLD